MKKSYIGYAGLALVLSLSAEQAHAQQGFGTDKPHKSAAVDITSPKRGLLIPRVKLVKTTNGESPIKGPAQSLMVYNENTHEDVTPGYYYWDTNRWVRFAKQSDITEITLVGDAVGKTGETKVVAIQGVSVIGAPTIANQVLMYNGTSWIPTTITASQLSDAKNLSAADGNNATIEVVTGGLNATLVETSLRVKNESITSAQIKNGEVKTEDLADKNVTAGKLVADPKDEGKVAVVQKDGSVKYENLASSNVIGQDVTAASDKVVLSEGAKGAALKAFTIDVDEKKLSLQNIGGKVTNDQITPGTAGQVMITSKDGKTTEWVDKSTLIPTTTNGLALNGNALTSTVNGVASSVDLEPAIQAGQKTVEVVNGTNTTVTKTPAEGGKHTTYAVNVSQEAIQAAQKTTTVVGTEKLVTVTPTVNNNNTEYKVSINKEEILKDQVNTVVRAGNGVIVSDGKATPEKDGKEVFYDVAIDTNGATKGQVLTVEGEGDNKTVKWTTPAADKDTNIYNVDGTLAGNRTVDLDGKTLNFIQKVTNKEVSTATFGQNGAQYALTLSSADRSNVQVASRGNGSTNRMDFFQDPNQVGQITAAGKNAGLQFNITSESGTNQGFAFTANQIQRMKLAADGKLTVGLFGSENGPVTETPRKVADFNSLEVAHGHVKIDEINQLPGNIVTDKVVVADSNGVLKTSNGAMPKFFYMPAVIFDTSKKGSGLQRNLYQDYVNQFTGGLPGTGSANYNIAHGADGGVMPYTGGIIGSEGAPADISVLNKEQLHYYVTYYDTSVFSGIKISKDGIMTYNIIGEATQGSYMTIVFVIKDSNTGTGVQ
ncbi:hypothetical protein VSP20_03010 [Myroides phaeus]|uniref:hypothetical protein n=1 Tax=Myroides phaeus TaxID=702745 RepID=UPI002DB7CE52|nr:hypothetical protein [Myroides phaeus]MEC4115930.1 hypothetical protein [Myroides phaeus]